MITGRYSDGNPNPQEGHQTSEQVGQESMNIYTITHDQSSDEDASTFCFENCITGNTENMAEDANLFGDDQVTTNAQYDIFGDVPPVIIDEKTTPQEMLLLTLLNIYHKKIFIFS